MENKKELNDNEVEKVSGGVFPDEKGVKHVTLELLDLTRNNNKFYNEVMECLDKCSGDPSKKVNEEFINIIGKYIDIDEDE